MALRGTNAHVFVVGSPISTYSRHIVQTLAGHAGISRVHITSVHRTVPDQARIFFAKHVLERTAANYKNKDVAHIIAHARAMHAKGSSNSDVQTYLVRAIEQAHGGPEAVSRHLLQSPFIEVFDVAHYSGKTKGPNRHDYMTESQARKFLEGCRKLIPFPIDRVGHSAELGLTMAPREFNDEKCFHLEIVQVAFDRLTVSSPTMVA